MSTRSFPGKIYNVQKAIKDGNYNLSLMAICPTNIGAPQLDVQKEKCSIARPKAGKEEFFMVRLGEKDYFPDDNLFVLVNSELKRLDSLVEGISFYDQSNIPLNAFDGRYEGFWITIDEDYWNSFPEEFSIIHQSGLLTERGE